MHGLTGGSWKRSTRRATATGKNDLTGNREAISGPVPYRRPTPPRQLSTLHGRFYRSAVHPLLHRINTYLMRWARKKYRRLRSVKRFNVWWKDLVHRAPELFAHWRWTTGLLPTGW